MRRIIDGRVFDTETAAQLCELPCSANPGDFAWHESALYRSPRGRFFIAGRGGPASLWAEPAQGGGSTGGDGIRIVDEDEARRWMEQAGCDEADFERAGLRVEEG